MALALSIGTHRYAGAAHVGARPAFIVLAAVGVAAVVALIGRDSQKTEQARAGEADPAGAFS
jgi:hypothetical protein